VKKNAKSYKNMIYQPITDYQKRSIISLNEYI